jgi:hypothetical protein
MTSSKATVNSDQKSKEYKEQIHVARKDCVVTQPMYGIEGISLVFKPRIRTKYLHSEATPPLIENLSGYGQNVAVLWMLVSDLSR